MRQKIAEWNWNNSLSEFFSHDLTVLVDNAPQEVNLNLWKLSEEKKKKDLLIRKQKTKGTHISSLETTFLLNQVRSAEIQAMKRMFV